MKKIMIVAAVFAAVSFMSCGNRTTSSSNQKDTVDTVQTDTVDTVHVDSVRSLASFKLAFFVYIWLRLSLL